MLPGMLLHLCKITDALIEAGMAPRRLFLVSDVGVTVSGIAGGTFCCEKTIAFTQHVGSSFASAQNDAASCTSTPIGIAGGFLQLIAKIMSVPECCARVPTTS
jgi:hypothetical protein